MKHNGTSETIEVKSAEETATGVMASSFLSPSETIEVKSSKL
jgi:hypothetical protein